MTASEPAPAPVVARFVADRVVPGEGDGVVLSNGAIDLDGDGRIVAVGRLGEMGPVADDVIVHRLNGAVLPGLVNAHAHTPMTVVRSVGDGLALDRWLRDAIWPREGRMNPEDAWWGMTLGSAEMLAAGVTTSCEMYLFEDEIVDAVQRSGARVVMTPGVISALLPDGDVAGRIAEIGQFHDDHHGRANGRISVGFAPHSVYDITPQQCAEIAQYAARHDAILHIHLDETRAERELIQQRYGCTATQALAEAGALQARTVAAHGVWLDAQDRRILAEAGASVAHCPISNLKLGSGIAPVTDLLADGVGVGLGTDGPASNDSLDLWEELKLAPLLARGRNHDARAMSATTALDLATRSGARAIGLDSVGQLRPGAWGDFMHLDLDQPGIVSDDDLLTQIVFAGSSRWVRDVWVAGVRRVADGEVLSVDLPQAIAEVRKRALRLAV